MYRYLIENGVPQESIGVYQIATPAVFVAGGGQYVTSDNDKIINLVRNAEVEGNVSLHRESFGALGGNVVASALRANISIPKEPGYDDNTFGGHKFQVYMNGAGDRIAKDIQGALSRLKASGGEEGGEGCFTPPAKDVSHQMKAAVYTVADPLAGAAVLAAKSMWQDLKNGAAFGLNTRGLAGPFAMNLFSKFTSQVPPISQSSAAAAPLETLESETAPSQPAKVPTAPTVAKTAPTQTQQNVPAPSKLLVPDTPSPVPTAPGIASPFALPSGMTPGFGGGGGSGGAQQASVPVAAQSLLTVLSPADTTTVATTSIEFSGTADANAAVFLDAVSSTYTAQADASGHWTLLLTLPEGVSNISITSGNATAVSRTVTVDTIAPATTTASISDCALSLSINYCLIPTSTTDMSWTAVPDAATYAVSINGTASAPTTSLSEAATLAVDATSTLAVLTYDLAGNVSTSTEILVRTVSNPLVISEIGWGGTDTTRDQWVEIKNISSQQIDLSTVSLARSGAAAIALSGTLDAGSFSIVDQSGPSPFPSFSTSTAEKLSLIWNGQVLDATPATDACASWCAGSWESTLGTNVSGLSPRITPLSMERISATSDGALASNWRSTDSYGPPTAPGQPAVWGTIGSENSAGYPDGGIACGGYSNLLIANTPYNPFGSCFFLMRFITSGATGPSRFGTLFRGTVGSSTVAAGDLFGKSIIREDAVDVPPDAVAGEAYFFAIYEHRSWTTDAQDFDAYFRTGVGTPPHGNYVAIPFTYQP